MIPDHAVSDELIDRARARSSATLHEAAKKSGALPAAIKPLSPEVCLCGRAYPVGSPSGDNLWLHHAIYAADPGDVLVVDVGADPEFGYWGEASMALAAQSRGLSGLVINGGVRDAQRLVAMKFPVFAWMANCIRGTSKNPFGKGSSRRADHRRGSQHCSRRSRIWRWRWSGGAAGGLRGGDCCGR